MKKALLAAIVIAVVLSGVVMASPDMGHSRDMKHKRMDHHKGYGKYSGRVQAMIDRAGRLEITDDQKIQLAKLKEDYLFPIIKEEADMKISKIKIMDMYHDPNFDPAALKKAIKKSNADKQEVQFASVDALDAIRKVIGKEKFGEMMSTMSGPMGMGGFRGRRH